MKKYLILFVLIFIYNNILAQKKISSSFSGQIFASTDLKALYVNFGGPMIKYKAKKISIGLGMFPSLRFKTDKPKSIVTPTLGTGIQLEIKKIVIGMPAYYVAANNSWYISVGFGLKL
jgi:hypothetical protein